ncbi:FUSC family protein [Celeribacter litoreus]|uniref:FUSC family protein n=1 Tax=Celeribacter litoreus TaxID=2876714 RepID=UPI001CCACD23|nr:FUSC family protein [Celeribacter litoreus]MCA0042958.1 FUSC family protein [Celeribacter litoreus]
MTLDWFTARGFSPARLAFAARTAIAVWIAIAIAWTIGLEHPQWSGMSVWAATLPTRGQLLEKGLFRVLGSISGTIAGVLLVHAMQIHPALLVVGLAVWVSACTYAGNLLRGFAAYGTVLAGYTAAMVALLDTGHPENVLNLGADRLATVLVGVAVATLAGFLFSKSEDAPLIKERVLAVLSEILTLAAAHAPSDDERSALLSHLAMVEDSLDPHSAGSMRNHQSIRSTRALLISATPLLLWDHGTRPPEGFEEHLTDAAQKLTAGDIASARLALTAAAELGTVSPQLRETLTTFERSLASWRLQPEPPIKSTVDPILHRDWVGAREAGLRAFAALIFFGAIWLASGWHVGGFMLLGLSIMLSIFSTFENPEKMMRMVFSGQFLGALGAIALRWLLWPHAGDEWHLIILMLPMIFIGPFITAHNKTQMMSFDYNMVLLLMSQPHLPLTGTLGASVEMGIAVIVAPLLAMIIYRVVYPPSLKRKADTLVTTMIHDLRDMAKDPKLLDTQTHWQARLYHRTLRLIRLSGSSHPAQKEARATALAVLNLGQSATWCHRITRDPDSSDSARRIVRAILARLSQISDNPSALNATLAQQSNRLTGADAALLQDARHGLEALMPRLQRAP